MKDIIKNPDHHLVFSRIPSVLPNEVCKNLVRYQAMDIEVKRRGKVIA